MLLLPIKSHDEFPTRSFNGVPAYTRRCLIATCESWPWIAQLADLVSATSAETVIFCPALLDVLSDFQYSVRCSRSPKKAAAELHSFLMTNDFDLVIVADEVLLQELLASPRFDPELKMLPIDPSDRQSLRMISSKHTFIETADALGIPVPEYRFAASTDDAGAAAGAIGYPVFLKGEHGFAGLQVRRAVDDASVRRHTTDLLRSCSRVLVQREVAGASVSACAVYDRGRLSAFKSFHAECTYPRQFSPSTVHSHFVHDDMENVLSKLGHATSFHGLVGIDLMHESSTGRLLVIELNPRPTIGFAGAAANRAFFTNSIKRLLNGTGPCMPVDVYDGSEAIQSYFPSYIFYLMTRNARRNREALHRLRLCLAERNARTWKSIAWETARFFGRHLKMSVSRMSFGNFW